MTGPSAPTMPLFCFPHAGAAATVYRPWLSPAADRAFEVHAVEQPGRGTRGRERGVDGFGPLVAELAAHVLAELGDRDRYAVFGHSFGSMIGLAVAAAIAAESGRPPVRAVLSAGLPPAAHRPVDEAADLDDDALVQRISALGGTPAALLSGGPLTRLVVRQFRADYAVRSAFSAQTGLRVDFPLTLIAARDDPHAPPNRMADWARHTTAETRTVTLDGGHFAAMDDPRPVLDAIRTHLTADASEEMSPGGR